ncbi:MAG: hypothetical protein ACC669_09710 [bacterium]
MIESIRKQIPQEEFDYQTLLDCLKSYSRPRDKISDFLQKGRIVRIKKGLYIFGEDYRRSPYSREILANLIYGPSYISLDYALHYYGLIPERVESVTSVTTGRSRKYFTPIGLFNYRGISLNAFRLGMDRIELSEGRSFLMAVPEKALADKIQSDRGTGIKTQHELRYYLMESLRIDESSLAELDSNLIRLIAQQYRSRKLSLLSRFIGRISSKKKRDPYA